MLEILDKFKNVKVLVFGDVMLDQYMFGETDRISPEAPVPVIELKQTKFIPGGAANVAANINGLGGQAYLCGLIGDDDFGRETVQALTDKQVASDYLIKSTNRLTTVKTRIIANNQQIARVDIEKSDCLNESEEQALKEKLDLLTAKVDLVVISDYAKGVVTERLCRKLIKLSRLRNIKVIVDPKGTNYLKYRESSLITPNQKETVEAFTHLSKQLKKDVGHKSFLKELKLEALLVTEGELGMTLYEELKKHKLTAETRNIFDVTGAGDTVLATMAVAIAAGATYPEAAYIANKAAGLVVQQIGTSVINFNKLYKLIKIDKGKTLTVG